jgi:hypothetical protein
MFQLDQFLKAGQREKKTSLNGTALCLLNRRAAGSFGAASS